MNESALNRFNLKTVIGFAILLLGYLFLRAHFIHFSTTESSRYFYIALSKIISQFGFIKNLPQTPALVWGNHFFDPNPLYTRLSALSFRSAGERGISLYSILISLGLLASLFWIAVKTTPSLMALLLCLFFTATPEFAYTLNSTGPTALEFLCFIWVFHAFLNARACAFWLSLLFYSLSTPNLHLSVSLVLLYPFVHLKNNRPNLSFWLPSLGVIPVFLYVHPYLPAHLNVIGSHILKTILVRERLFGAELPLRTDEFIRIYGVFLLFTLGSAISLSLNKKYFVGPSITLFRKCQGLLAGTLLFWFWTAYFRPMALYAVLLTFFLVGTTLGMIQTKSQKYLFYMVLVIGLFPLSRFYLRKLEPQINPNQYASALNAIPTSSIGKRVLNCTPTDGDFVFYFRPDLRVLDLHSPGMLAESMPAAHTAREDFKRTIRSNLETDYVLCDLPDVFEKLIKDSNYTRLFSVEMAPSGARSPYLFARNSLNREIAN